MSKQKILDAAVKLFSELGYHRTSMDDIASEAGVAKGTLYYNFSGKGELFESIVMHGYQMLKGAIEQVLYEEQSPGKQISMIVHKHIELFLNYSPMVHIISNELTNGLEHCVLERIDSVKQDYLEFLSTVLREGQADDVLIRVSSPIAAAGLLGLIESASLYYVKHKGNFTVSELYDTVNAFITSALLVR